MNPRLALAILPPFLACGLQWLLWDFIDPYVWFLFFPAAYFSAWLGGLRGGLAGTAFSALLVWYVFMPPAFSFALFNPASAFSIALFVVMGALFSWFFERLRQAQARSDARFEATFEQAAVGIAHVAPDGRWLRVNRTLCDIVGYSQAELLTRTFQDITHPNDLDADLNLLRQMLARLIDTYSMEKRYFRKDGGIVWIKLTVSLVWRPDGVPDYFISVVEDIQARKAADEALSKSEGMLSSFVENLESIVWVKDPAGRFLRINRHMEKALGHPREEVLGRTVAELFPADEAGAYAENDSQVIAQGRSMEFEEVARLTDGPHTFISTKFPLRDGDGMIQGLGAVCTDITEHKRAAEELKRRNEELERFDQASVGRELEMIELKRRVNALSRELGREAPFDLSFADVPTPAAVNPAS